MVKLLQSLLFLYVVAFMPLSAEGKKISSLEKRDAIKLTNIAGRQRMLSQRIAKDYLYIGKDIVASKAKKELEKSIKEFENGQKQLEEMINDPEIKNLLNFVNLSFNELKDTIKKPFNLNNAQLVLDLTESMLEGTQYIVDNIKKKAKIKESVIIAKAGRQRMLSQRIAKYYIAYQAGIKDKNTVEQMNRAVKEFEKTQKELMKNPDNTASINKRLNEIEKLWKIVYKFYLNIEKGGLPFIVYKTTDDITDKMDSVLDMYTDIYSK